MINIVNKNNCSGCTACVNICQHNALSMNLDQYGHYYPILDKEKCVNCNLCEQVCPFLNKDRIPKDYDIEALPILSVYNKNYLVRKHSTSGGFFAIIAEYIIKQGGVVYAARFNEKFEVIHSLLDDLDKIYLFQGSKYVQSDLSDIFKKIKYQLKTKKVLFVGMPCQVAGLKGFLKKEEDNLFTCDFICMGISSPLVWKSYLNNYWDISTIKKIVFKDKRDSWHNWRMLINDVEGEHLIEGMKDPFFYSFLSQISCRPSCFQCPFRSLRHISEFTIADCWGIDIINPSFDDDKGCSSLILQNDKAKSVFEAIKDNLYYSDFPSKAVIKYNPFSVKQIYNTKKRDKFYSYWEKKGICYALDKSLKDSKLKFFRKAFRKFLVILKNCLFFRTYD